MPYKHTQIGYSVILAMLVFAGVALIFHSLIFLCVSLLGGVLLSTLTVSVESDGVSLWFGPGFLPTKFSLGDIESCQISKSRCWGLGVLGIPGKCRYFHVSGAHSVELKMRQGGKFFIGTDQPEALEKAIHHAIQFSLHRAMKGE